MITSGYRVSFGGDETVLEIDSGDICTRCEYTKTRRIVYFERVNLMVCELHLDF